jgi:hypothetical protein
MKDGLAAGARRPREIEAVILVHAHARLAGDVAAPLVVSVDAIGVSRTNRREQVTAHQVPAVVLLAEPFEPAVRQLDRLQLGEERRPDAIPVQSQQNVRALVTRLAHHAAGQRRLEPGCEHAKSQEPAADGQPGPRTPAHTGGVEIRGGAEAHEGQRQRQRAEHDSIVARSGAAGADDEPGKENEAENKQAFPVGM